MLTAAQIEEIRERLGPIVIQVDKINYDPPYGYIVRMPKDDGEFLLNSVYLLLDENTKLKSEREQWGNEFTAVILVKDQLADVVAERDRMKAALTDLFAMMDEKILVRNTDHDHDPDWAIRLLEIGSRLSEAYQALHPKPSTNPPGACL
jgi:hypothetical protein